MRVIVQTTLIVSLFSWTSWAGATQPPSSQTPQDVQGAICTANHQLAGLSLQELIELLCTADLPGSNVTTFDNASQAHKTGPVQDRDKALGFGGHGPRVSSGQTTKAAGDHYGPLNVWGSVTWTGLTNDFVSTLFDSTSHVLTGGADLQPTDNLIVGLSLGYENTDVGTAFNGGTQDINGVTGLGYVGYLISDTFSVDASLGTTAVDIDQTRTLSAFGAAAGPFAGVAAGTIITSQVDAQRYFGAVNLNGFWEFDDWLVGANTGYLRARGESEHF